jgi:hypothetical protein
MTTHADQRTAPAQRRARAAWPLERVLFALAGTVILVTVLLAATVSPWWLLLGAFAGANQLAFAAFGDCVASLVLRRIFGLESGCAR